MIVESIRVLPKNKRIKHFTASGIQDIKTDKKGDEAVSEGLAYVNNYTTENGFKVINVTTMEAGTVYYIIYDIVKE